jgi:hypothetical protein
MSVWPFLLSLALALRLAKVTVDVFGWANGSKELSTRSVECGPRMLSRGYFPLALGAADIVENQFDPVFYGNYTMASGLGAWATSTLYALNDPRMAGFSSAVKRGTSSAVAGGPVVTAFNTTIVDGTARWLFIGSTTSKGIFRAWPNLRLTWFR